MNVRLTRRAAAELEQIYFYGLDRYGKEQSESYIAGFWQTAEFLATFPDATRIREEADSLVRAYPYGSHLIVYDTEAAGIVVLRIPHARSDWIND